jgi:MFS family permease
MAVDIALAAEPPVGETPDARPTQTLPLAHLIRISLYWLGLTAIDGAVGGFNQNRLNFGSLAVDPNEVGRILFLMSIPVAIISIAVQPTIGAISDFTVSRWGRRKPYIVIGSLLDVVFLIGIAEANSILMLAGFAALLSFSTNFARGPFQGYVPDLVPDRQVGLASAMVGLMQVLGNIVGFALITIAVSVLHRIELAIFAVALVELVTMLAVVARVGKGQPPRPREGKSWLTVAKSTWGTDVLKERSYVWLLVSRLFFLMGGAMLVNFFITYMKQSHGLEQSAANEANLSLLVTIAITSILTIVPSARLSDRIGRKPVIYASCVIGFVGVAIAAFAPVVPIAIVGGALFGASAGTFLAVDWALMTDIIPKASSGRYMGLSNVATTSSTVLAVATGGILLDAVNIAMGTGSGPRAAYVLGALYYLVAAVTLRPVVEPPRSGRRAAGIPTG